ncbi:hypothetical protein [Endozoicomonas sp. Mp262]
MKLLELLKVAGFDLGMQKLIKNWEQVLDVTSQRQESRPDPGFPGQGP